MRIASILALFATLTINTDLRAQGPKLSGLQLGEERVGKKPAVSELSGKVVLVEIWGIN